MKPRVPVRVGALLCACVFVLSGCGGGEADTEPPVATPSVTLNKTRAAIGSPIQITYKFTVAPDAKIDGDYTVFLHVIEPDGERLWQDDHQPPVPTSQWAPGQTIEYTRTVFVANYPYIGEASVRVGLYDQASSRRLPLAGEAAGQREYHVGRLEILPQAENIFLIYKEGWHPLEVDANNPAIEWQWTKQNASISFRNPKRDATFYLEYDTRADLFTPPQQVTITVGGAPIGTFEADSRDRTLRTFPITAAQFGDGEMAEIQLQVDRTFTPPGGGDVRELGIRVFQAFVEPK